MSKSWTSTSGSRVAERGRPVLLHRGHEPSAHQLDVLVRHGGLSIPHPAYPRWEWPPRHQIASPSSAGPSRTGRASTSSGTRAGRCSTWARRSSLRKRVAGHFSKHGARGSTDMVAQIADIEFIATETEAEALLAEQEFIKRHRPVFNVRLRDDKSYPYIGISLDEDFPRIYFTRERHRKNRVYFGPSATPSACARRSTCSARSSCTAPATAPSPAAPPAAPASTTTSSAARPPASATSRRRRTARTSRRSSTSSPGATATSRRRSTRGCARRPRSRSSSRPPSTATS